MMKNKFTLLGYLYHLCVALAIFFVAPKQAIAQIDSLPVQNEKAVLIKSKV